MPLSSHLSASALLLVVVLLVQDLEAAPGQVLHFLLLVLAVQWVLLLGESKNVP